MTVQLPAYEVHFAILLSQALRKGQTAHHVTSADLCRRVDTNDDPHCRLFLYPARMTSNMRSARSQSSRVSMSWTR